MTIHLNSKCISHTGRRFTHDGVAALANAAMECPAATVLIDLSSAEEAEMAALAALVLLRKRLLEAGRDLFLTGLWGQVRALHLLCRLQRVLPLHEERRQPPSLPRRSRLASLAASRARCQSPTSCAQQPTRPLECCQLDRVSPSFVA